MKRNTYDVAADIDPAGTYALLCVTSDAITSTAVLFDAKLLLQYCDTRHPAASLSALGRTLPAPYVSRARRYSADVVDTYRASVASIDTSGSVGCTLDDPPPLDPAPAGGDRSVIVAIASDHDNTDDTFTRNTYVPADRNPAPIVCTLLPDTNDTLSDPVVPPIHGDDALSPRRHDHTNDSCPGRESRSTDGPASSVKEVLVDVEEDPPLISARTPDNGVIRDTYTTLDRWLHCVDAIA